MKHGFITQELAKKALATLLAATVWGMTTGAWAAEAGAPTGLTVKIPLSDPNLIHYFPNAADPDMPAFYYGQTGFPQTLDQSIALFVNSSLKNDGIAATATVTLNSQTEATVTITAQDDASLASAQGYATMLTKMIDSSHAGLGWNGVNGCEKASSCWPNPQTTTPPWAYFLPLGMPLVNQKAVMFLNYPPSDALCSATYLNNYTMARWNTVLTTVGIPAQEQVLFETIVDKHPIAAAGSGQSTAIANTSNYFYDPNSPNYDVNMLQLLLNPPGQTGQYTPPLQVAGLDARETWQSIIGGVAVNVGTGGTFTWPDGDITQWVATNHPDVAGYQTCAGDPLGGKSPALVADVLLDLNAACALQSLAQNPQQDPNTVLQNCSKTWCTGSQGCNEQALCVQARMDYDYKSKGNCQCQEAAQAFCQANANNPCPSQTEVTTCTSFNEQYCQGVKPAYQKCSYSAAK